MRRRRSQGVVLAATFAVSHNVEEAKPLAAGNPATASLAQDHTARDWGVQQVLSQSSATNLGLSVSQLK